MCAAVVPTTVFAGLWRGAGRAQQPLMEKSERRERIHLPGRDAVTTLAWCDKQHMLLRHLAVDRPYSPDLSPAWRSFCWGWCEQVSFFVSPPLQMRLRNGNIWGWKEWSGIFQIPEVPEVFCIDNVNVYICISDNREVGEMVGFWVGMGGCCEMGASEMAQTWDRSLEKMDALAWSVLPQSGAGNHTGFEMWNRREKKSASQGIKGIYFRDLKDWRNYFPWLFLLYSMLMTACNSHFCWWKCGRCIFCPTVISLSLYLSIQYHIPYGII